MIIKNKYPICEFDTNDNAKIKASDFLEKSLPKRCVITFFRKELEEFVSEKRLPIIGKLHSEVVDLPIYGYDNNTCIAIPFAAAPGAAVTLEELYAMGCEKFIVCGGAGCIIDDMDLGKIIIPTSAIRDEGTSYHYIEPADEIECNDASVKTIMNALDSMNVPYITGKTWTTDAIYRETADMIELRKNEGCITVEMETAAFFAVSKYYNIRLVQLLYAGDDLSGEKWDSRNWNEQNGVRRNLIDIALELIREI